MIIIYTFIRLAVHPDFQKKGIGKILMDFAEKYAKEKKFVICQVRYIFCE